MIRYFFIALIIICIAPIGWGIYNAKINFLDYLFEIGVIISSLGISILWQMKIFFLKPEHKKSFSNWRKNPDKKFVTLFMRDEQRMLPFIVPLTYLARTLVIFGIMTALGDWFLGGVKNIIDTRDRLLILGLATSLCGVLSTTQSSYNLIGGRKQEVEILKKWKENPSFAPEQSDSEMTGLATFYILECIIIATMQIGILCFFAGLIIWLIN